MNRVYILCLLLIMGCQEKPKIPETWYGTYYYTVNYENCLATASSADTVYYPLDLPLFLTLNDTTNRFILAGNTRHEGAWALEGKDIVRLTFDSLFAYTTLKLRADGSLLIVNKDSLCSYEYTVLEALSPPIEEHISPSIMQKTLANGIWKVELPTNGASVDFMFDSTGKAHILQFFEADTTLPAIQSFGNFLGSSWYNPSYFGQGRLENFTIRFLQKVSEEELLIDFYNPPTQILPQISAKKIRMLKQHPIEEQIQLSKKQKLYGSWEAARHPMATKLPKDRHYEDDYFKITFDSINLTLSWGGSVVYKDSVSKSDKTYSGSWELGDNGKLITFMGEDDPNFTEPISFKFLSKDTIQMTLANIPISSSEGYPYGYMSMVLYKSK